MTTTTTTISGVAVLITAAILNWQLMLVMLGCIPVIGASVGILTQMMSSTTQEGSSHYSKAGGVATEVRCFRWKTRWGVFFFAIWKYIVSHIPCGERVSTW